MKLLITGATGLTGNILLDMMAREFPQKRVDCLIRPSSNLTTLENINLDFQYHRGDSSSRDTWDRILSQNQPETIIHIATVRHIGTILDSLEAAGQTPRLIIIGSTGVYSQYGEYSNIYKKMEQRLKTYSGSYCLLRPTMIYGSPRDKNIHKLINFCDRYGFFFVFGDGQCLLQPVHTEDLAKALFSVFQKPEIRGSYDLSGGSVVTYRELLNLVSEGLNKTVRQLYFPFTLSALVAGMMETLLKSRSPIRKEQILRLQEDKAYSHDAARKDFNFQPRSLKVGIQQEIELMLGRGKLS